MTLRGDVVVDIVGVAVEEDDSVFVGVTAEKGVMEDDATGVVGAEEDGDAAVAVWD